MKANLDNDRFFLKKVKEGFIKITKNGIVTNLKTGRVIGSINGGYYRIGFKDYENNKIRLIQVHRLVWLVYKGIIPNAILINHKDGNKLNNNLSNLELNTNRQNNKHAYDIGLNKVSNYTKCLASERLKGEKNINAHFTDKQVIILRKKVKKGLITLRDISNKYSISIKSIRFMLSGKTYGHVKGKLKGIKGKIGAPNKFTENDIKEMVRMRNDGYLTGEIAKKFNTHRSTISIKTSMFM